jgi:hypothetical protein
VAVVTSTGDRVPAGPLEIAADRPGAGLVLPDGLDGVAAVVLVPREGGEILEGKLPPPQS